MVEEPKSSDSNVAKRKMNIRLKAKSSSSEPYDVDFLFENGTLRAHCTCKAGVMRTACKHRLALLKGDQNMLADPSQADQLATVVDWAVQAGFPALLQQLSDAEAQVSRAQREVKNMKKILEDGMTRGLRREP